MGITVQAVPANLALEEEIAAVVEAHEHRYGRMDVLVNNAGMGISAEIDEYSVKHIDLAARGQPPRGDPRPTRSRVRCSAAPCAEHRNAFWSSTRHRCVAERPQPLDADLRGDQIRARRPDPRDEPRPRRGRDQVVCAVPRDRRDRDDRRRGHSDDEKIAPTDVAGAVAVAADYDASMRLCRGGLW